MRRVLREEYILLNRTFRNYDECIKKLVGVLKEHGITEKEEELIEEIHYRESIMTTYCGDGLALPHVISNTISVPAVIICTCNDIVWNEDMDRTDLIVLIVIPKGDINNDYEDYEEGINRIIDKISEDEFRDEIRKANDIWEIIRLVNE